jgi:phosphate transport system substrate-binding protein
VDPLIAKNLPSKLGDVPVSLCCGLRAIVVGFIGGILSLSPATAETLKIGGTGAVTALLGEMAPAFTADTGMALQVVPGLGTSGAINAVADGKLGMAFSGRPLRDKEVARGLKAVATWRTPFGFVTSRAAPNNFDKAWIAELYRADRPLWPDGTPILIHLRPSDESDNAVLGESFPGMTEALQGLRKRPDLSVAATDQDNAEMAEKVKGSLTAATLTQIISEKRKLTFVSIDGVAVTLENYEKGSYPYAKSLYVIVPAVVSPAVQTLITFLTQPAGESLMRRAGMIASK